MNARLGVLAAALTAATSVLFVQAATPTTTGSAPVVVTRVQPELRPHGLPVSSAADTGKPGELRSTMGQWVLAQDPYTSGPSPDSLRFTFDAPARVVGIVISVDISGPQLVEVVAGINTPAPYGLATEGTGQHRGFSGRDWLLHTSDSNTGGPSKIDEQAWFPEGGFHVGPGDYVAVDAWLGNHTGAVQGVSPEVIVYYVWGSA